MTQDEATDWAAGWIQERWASRGLVGTARFYANKAAWNWGDGMFWAWGEGQDARPERLPPGDGLVGLCETSTGRTAGGTPSAATSPRRVWVALLFVAGLGAVLTRRPRPEVLLVALSVLGVLAFTLLFQGRSRYLFTFVPVVVAMAAMVHPAVSATRARLVRALRRSRLRLSSLRRSGAGPS